MRPAAWIVGNSQRIERDVYARVFEGLVRLRLADAEDFLLPGAAMIGRLCMRTDSNVSRIRERSVGSNA